MTTTDTVGFAMGSFDGEGSIEPAAEEGLCVVAEGAGEGGDILLGRGDTSSESFCVGA